MLRIHNDNKLLNYFDRWTDAQIHPVFYGASPPLGLLPKKGEKVTAALKLIQQLFLPQH